MSLLCQDKAKEYLEEKQRVKYFGPINKVLLSNYIIQTTYNMKIRYKYLTILHSYLDNCRMLSETCH